MGKIVVTGATGDAAFRFLQNELRLAGLVCSPTHAELGSALRAEVSSAPHDAAFYKTNPIRDFATAR
jgi:hypothetical protein